MEFQGGEAGKPSRCFIPCLTKGKIMFTIWYCDADSIVRSFECDTIIYAQAVWDTLAYTKHMLSSRP